MTASSSSDRSISVADVSEGPVPGRSSPVGASQVSDMAVSGNEQKVWPTEGRLSPNSNLMEVPSIDSTETPRASGKGTVQSSTVQPATPSPTPPEAKDSSPQSQMAPAAAVVSHVPASVNQPVFPPSEQSSQTSPVPQHHNVHPSDVSAAQLTQQEQPRDASSVVADAPILKSMPVGQGPVVKKGRFRLLQNAPIIEDGSEGSKPRAVGDVPAVVPTPAESGALHPLRERSLSNTSTLSAMSVPGAHVAPPPPAAAVPSAASSTETLGTATQTGPPVVKKKGRFVVIPGDVTDPAIIARGSREGVLTRQITPTGQPFSGQQGASHGAVQADQVSVSQQQQGTMQPVVAQDSVHQMHQVQVQTGISQPGMIQQVVTQDGGVQQVHLVPYVPQQQHHVVQQQVTMQDGTQQMQTVRVPEQQYQGHVPQQQYQANPPVYYQVAPPQQVGPPQLAHYPQQQQQQQLQGPATHQSSPGPPPSHASQSSVRHYTQQPPADVLVSGPPSTPPPHHLQREMPQQVVAGPQRQVYPAAQVRAEQPQHSMPPPHPQQQQLASDTDGAAAEVGLHAPTDAPLPPQQVPAGAQVPPGDATKLPQSAKAAAKPVKRPSFQRPASSFCAKGAQANVGFGKVYHFLDQMKLEVTEADRTIKAQQKDMKFMRERNKELEAKSRDMEKRWLDEKVAREALEAKVRSLRKKVKELKKSMAANNVDNIKEVDEKLSEVAELTQPPSRSDSLDDSKPAVPDKAGSPGGVTRKSQKPETTPCGSPVGVTRKADTKSAISTEATTSRAATKGSGPVAQSAVQRKPTNTGNTDERELSNTQTKTVGGSAVANEEAGSSARASRVNEEGSDLPTASTKSTKSTISGEDKGRPSSGDQADGAKSSQHPAQRESVPPSSIRSESGVGSPSRGRATRQLVRDKVEMGRSLPVKSEANAGSSQTMEIGDDSSNRNVHEGGMAALPPLARSTDSLGSTGSLRGGSQGAALSDGSHVNPSVPAAYGQGSQAAASLPTGSLVTIVAPPAVSQTVDFDPLGVSYDRGSRADGGVTAPHIGVGTSDVGMRQNLPNVSANASVSSMEAMNQGSLQTASHHSHSQSMPNFVLQNGMFASMGMQQQPMAAYTAQQMEQMQMMSGANIPSQIQPNWNQYQQAAAAGQQNQYIPSQYSTFNTAASQQPQQQQQALSDPFDELASRRAPGTVGQGQGGLQQHQQQKQQPHSTWTNQPS